MEVPRKTKNRTTIRFSNSASGYLSEGDKNTNSEKIHALPCLLQYYLQKPRRGSILRTDEWKKKPYYLNTHTHEHTMQYYSAIKKEILLFGTTWMDPEGITLREINQTKKDKYMISCMYEMEGKEERRKEGTKSSIHPYREQAGGCQRQGTGNR